MGSCHPALRNPQQPDLREPKEILRSKRIPLILWCVETAMIKASVTTSVIQLIRKLGLRVSPEVAAHSLVTLPLTEGLVRGTERNLRL